ncbi:discoidin domain-containing protein [Pectobacterium sp. CFBP8739]|uniref:discoidin domain-containing protein n=1 Tax=Pectobacterium sp. CFBP8739 TaxID=2748908 RepID=UPI0015DD7C55|nr:discoidin domain-containing protein [Pectobacterium sp. CFBP8739]MBA0167578.1 discoidin domain-containing protein [Pectobacterium sp. CFBP8739]
MKNLNIEINVCDSTGKATCTVNPPVCCHSDNESGQEPGVSGVTSVFGRTGMVTAQDGDYTADQITETATRKFASPDEKATWNEKQDALLSGTTIRTVFGQSLLGSGDISPTPAQMGVAAIGHTHTTADITDYTQKTKQLIHSSLEAGAGVTLSYNPVNEKTVISATGGGSSSGGSGYIVADRLGATAGQNHAFSISPQNAFNLAAYALKEEAGAANQTYVVDDFNASSEPNYNATNDVTFDGIASLYTGSNYQLVPDGKFYSAEIKADGKIINIYQVADSDTVIPKMTSNIAPLGYIASASNFAISNATYAPWVAFDGSNNIGRLPDCWSTDESWQPVPSKPHWLQIELPNKTAVSRYQIINRSQNQLGGPNSWILQGSDDGTVWIDLHQVIDDKNNEAGAVRDFNIDGIASYSKYRLMITKKNGDKPFLTIAEFKLFPPDSKFVFYVDGKYYGVTEGNITEISGELSAEKINQYGILNSGEINTGITLFSKSVKIVSEQPIKVKTRYTPYTQIAIQKSLTSAAWSKINAATLTATQTGNGKVRVAVTRDLVNWHVLRNGAWVDVGALSADTVGATKLIADGMTPADLGAITAAQWTQLFASNNGVPDSLAFAFALDITDPAADVATIDRLVLNVNDASSWKVQSPAEVEIRWRTDSVTFRTVTAGNYKLAYQVP